MTTILGVVGSPRSLGNCEIMVKEISRCIPVSHRLKLLRLSDFNILPCRGCYRCLFPGRTCNLDDDFQTVVESFLTADAVIVAVPAYFLGPNAGLKRLMDRGLAFQAHADSLWGKPSVGIAVAGIEGKEGYSLLGVESFLKLILSDLKAATVVYGALPGEAMAIEKNRKAAADLARALFAPRSPNPHPCCPLCGGETFRFLPGGGIRCMLCSNSGTLETDSGMPVFRIHPDEHTLFLSLEGVKKHRQWLLGMKDRFDLQRQSLKEIRKVYRGMGEWVGRSGVGKVGR